MNLTTFIDLYTQNKYIEALTIVISIFLSLTILNFIFNKLIKKLVKRTKIEWDDVIINFFTSFNSIFNFALSLYLTVLYLQLNNNILKGLSIIISIYIIINLIKSLKELATYFIKNSLHLSNSMQDIFIRTIEFLLWTIGIIFFTQNLGINVSAILGGLGVVGIAVAFALQNVLEDIFAFFSIQIDQTVQPGDYIESGDMTGTIIKIGLKSTRIMATTGEEIIMNNRALISSLIHNFGRMKERRIIEKIGVTYDTSPKQLLWIKEFLSTLLSNTDNARLDRVHFSKFGDSALIITLSYYITSSDYLLKMDTVEKINLNILKEFIKENIDIAYPTQTIHIQNN